MATTSKIHIKIKTENVSLDNECMEIVLYEYIHKSIAHIDYAPITFKISQVFCSNTLIHVSYK